MNTPKPEFEPRKPGSLLNYQAAQQKQKNSMIFLNLQLTHSVQSKIWNTWLTCRAAPTPGNFSLFQQVERNPGGGEMLSEVSDLQFCNPRHHSYITSSEHQVHMEHNQKGIHLTFGPTCSSPADSLGIQCFLLTSQRKELQRDLRDGESLGQVPALRNSLRQWVYLYLYVQLQNRASCNPLKLLQF